MKYRILTSALAIILTSCQPAPPPTGTAITNVTVIDAVNGVRENQTVVFDGESSSAGSMTESAGVSVRKPAMRWNVR